MDEPVHPICIELLDAYIVPLSLERARRAALKDSSLLYYERLL
jgi:hypothetical protein